MCSNISVSVKDISKKYKIFNNPKDRLIYSLLGKRKNLFSEHWALKDITFDVERGKTVGIIGSNGSGKSTLLQIISSILTPTSGQVHVNGRIAALLELGSGFNPEFTGRENAFLNGAILGINRKEMDSRIDDIIKFADIGCFIDQPVKTYSSGMFVRLAFAVAINVDPDILIIDEALAVGDTSFQLKCIDKMKSIKKQGKTILFVSHDIYSIRNFCEQVIWLKDGQICMYGNVLEVTDIYMDYMKKKVDVKKVSEDKVVNTNDILEICSARFINNDGKDGTQFEVGENFKIIVDYELKKEIDGLIGGIAVFDSRGTYICGLNTKLDKIMLPSAPERYQLILSYKDMNLLPGSYYIDVGFFESSGIIPLKYINKINSFQVVSNKYLAEGLSLLKHDWNFRKLGKK